MPTQKQTNSLMRIRRSIEIIQDTAPAEIEGESMDRRKNMVRAYESMQTHAHHLGIRPPQLGTYYKPEQYLAHANKVLVEVDKLYDEKTIEMAPLHGSRPFDMHR